MIVLTLPLVLLLPSLPLQDLPDQVTQLHAAAVEAHAAKQNDRAVFLLRRAVAEAAIAGSTKSAKEVRALLKKLSPKEAERKKLLSSAARLLRSAGQGYCRKKLWAQALPLLSLAQRVHPTLKGSQALRACLLDHEDAGKPLPLARLLAPELAKDYNKNGFVLPFKMDGETLMTPTWKEVRSFDLLSGLAAVPGLRIDCEVRLAAPEAKAGICFGSFAPEWPYYMLETVWDKGTKDRPLGLYKYVIPPGNSYLREASFWEEPDEEEWRNLHIEIRSEEVTVALSDAAAHVTRLPGANFDGELFFHSTSSPEGGGRNSYRNLRVNVLPTFFSHVGKTPKKLRPKLLSRLLESAELATQMQRLELAEAYIERATRLLAVSPSTNPMSMTILERIHKADSLYKQARDARSSAAKKLRVVAKGEEKAGRKVLATHYRMLSLSADQKGKARVPRPEEQAALSGLMPMAKTMLEKAKRSGGLSGWKMQEGVFHSPKPSGGKTAALLLPGNVAAGTAVFFDLRRARTGMGFVFGHRGDRDQYTLGFEVGRTDTTVFLDQEHGDEPLNLMEIKLPNGKDEKAMRSLPVLVLLHEHHIFLKIGRLAPRIIALDKRRLSGRIGFRLLPDAGPDPFTVAAFELRPL